MDASDGLLLLIEDEPTDATLVRRALSDRSGAKIRIEQVPALEPGLERLARGGVCAVLLDLNLPDSRGVETVVRLRERDADVPIVVFTVAGDEETAVAALGAGAQDYLVKDDFGPSLLRRSLRYAIERRRIAREKDGLERRLRESERMASLGVLCAGIGFGLNTIVGTILDSCHEALASLQTSEHEDAVAASLMEIHRASSRAAEMVQHLRDYGELERSASGQVDLARLTLEACELLSSMIPAEIEISCEVLAGAGQVEVEHSELCRALLALVLNGAEAIGERPGSISITTGSLEASPEFLASTRGWPHPEPGTYAFLRVADTGVGCGARARERIFDPFYTTKFAGRGLGLASVFGMLFRHRAVVRIDANRPAGSVFTLLFPCSGPGARRQQTGPERCVTAVT